MSVTDYLEAPARQVATLDETEHRPWPLARGSWIQAQTWDDLLFAHWRVSEEALRSHVPENLELDSFDGAHWLGITPFRVTGLRLRGTFPIPGLSSFLELNVRTYVTSGDKPGIWFFSLDAASRLAVEAARRTYALPYHHAAMSADRLGSSIQYSSRRRDDGHRFEGRYGSSGDPAPPEPGTLDHFLTERYCLYTTRDGKLSRAEIHHPPEIDLEGEPLLHFSERQDVVIWPLHPV